MFKRCRCHRERDGERAPAERRDGGRGGEVVFPDRGKCLPPCSEMTVAYFFFEISERPKQGLEAINDGEQSFCHFGVHYSHQTITALADYFQLQRQSLAIQRFRRLQIP